jgi:hypothetical protein
VAGQSDIQVAEVTCPNCGHLFSLGEKVIDRYRRVWERTTRQRVRNELRAENQKDIEREAQRLSAKELLEKDEELREAKKQNARLRTQVTNLSKKMPAPRAQALGDERQETLAERLAARCLQDEVTSVARGVRGADVVQAVRDPAGRPCGTILWESKRAANWSKGWVAKLRKDMRQGDHAIGVIVSDASPQDDDRPLTDVDGVWVTNIDVAPDLALILRDMLIQVVRARGARAGRDDLKGRVYDYVAGGFVTRFNAMVEKVVLLRKSAQQDRAAQTARWSEQDQYMDDMVVELAGVYGDFRGIGASLPAVDLLELPAPEASDALPPAA